jgi:hypothetical protein
MRSASELHSKAIMIVAMKRISAMIAIFPQYSICDAPCVAAVERL